MERYFYTCSCHEDQNVKFVLNLLRWGAKHWWEFVTQSFLHADRAIYTWDHFREMFRGEYVPLVERE